MSEQDYPAEDWRAIPGWEGSYEVSDIGRVRSLDRMVNGGFGGQRSVHGHLREAQMTDRGRPCITLHTECRSARKFIHTLVALAFIGPLPDDKEVAHWDGDPTNNRVKNLRYCTRAENHADKRRHGTHIEGEAHHSAILGRADVLAIRRIYRSGCATQQTLATRFGVHRGNIQKIVTRKTWRSV